MSENWYNYHMQMVAQRMAKLLTGQGKKSIETIRRYLTLECEWSESEAEDIIKHAMEIAGIDKPKNI